MQFITSFQSTIADSAQLAHFSTVQLGLTPGPPMPVISIRLKPGDRFPLHYLLHHDFDAMLRTWDTEMNDPRLFQLNCKRT